MNMLRIKELKKSLIKRKRQVQALSDTDYEINGTMRLAFSIEDFPKELFHRDEYHRPHTIRKFELCSELYVTKEAKVYGKYKHRDMETDVALVFDGEKLVPFEEYHGRMEMDKA